MRSRLRNFKSSAKGKGLTALNTIKKWATTSIVGLLYNGSK